VNDALRVEIERYLDGAMTPAESEGFLATLREDPEALAFLGRALEDQAHLFDAIRAAAPSGRRGDTTRRLRIRRTRAWPRSGPSGTVWAAGVAAAGLFALLLALSTSGEGRRVRVPAPARVIVVAPVPTPEPLPAPRTAPRPEPMPLEPLRPAPAPARIEAPAPLRPEAPEPGPVPEPPRPEPVPVRDPVRPSAVAMAELTRVQGEGVVLDASGRSAAKPGTALLSGQGLQTGSASLLQLKFPDATRVELGASSVLREARIGPAGKRLRLDAGLLSADVAKQTPGAPLVVTTPQADVVVLGTRFSVSCSAESTRVEVREGRVRVARLSDGASVEVGAEFVAVVGASGPVEAKPFPIDEIFLSPQQARIVGNDWHPVKDVEAGSGVALESLKAQKGPLQEAPCVVYTVNAEAGKLYHVWVRGKCLAKSSRIEHDAVVLDFGESEVSEPPGPNKGQTGSLERGLFNGFMHQSGYGWVGSDSDQGRDSVPVTVRFSKPGRQILRLYSWESPLRIDAIWLSATQKTRPDDAQTAPPRK